MLRRNILTPHLPWAVLYITTEQNGGRGSAEADAAQCRGSEDAQEHGAGISVQMRTERCWEVHGGISCSVRRGNMAWIIALIPIELITLGWSHWRDALAACICTVDNCIIYIIYTYLYSRMFPYTSHILVRRDTPACLLLRENCTSGICLRNAPGAVWNWNALCSCSVSTYVMLNKEEVITISPIWRV